jgi:hypothetical protein
LKPPTEQTYALQCPLKIKFGIRTCSATTVTTVAEKKLHLPS